MIRTLVIIAAVSFTLCIGCIAGAFAVAGGPFSIDDHWRYHHGSWLDDEGPSVDIQIGPPAATAPARPAAPVKPAPGHAGAAI